MGPISHTGPKTSRAARDGPEPNPRRNQTSRYDIAGDSPERRSAGGAATAKNARGAKGKLGRNITRASRGQRATGARICRRASHRRMQNGQPACFHRRNILTRRGSRPCDVRAGQERKMIGDQAQPCAPARAALIRNRRATPRAIA
ncbi:nucleobase-ascorbate transporter 12 [Dorcoceras hygrometricum]|uniref:Nucleobase-ascorbate transporter 12 n=1 Tax=Dorcoceras hygrometricum TaxID=472368 RepID=A0A2Z6ZS12_9LAMI|nr:nucleobase-ascorbate transporter 12 [Dorcoceras hygrometricum]